MRFTRPGRRTHGSLPPSVHRRSPSFAPPTPSSAGLKLTDFPRTIKVADNVYTYEDFHAGDEKFTTTNMFVVTDQGVLVADGQGSVPETKGLVDAIAKVTTQPIKYVVICSDHGDHTAGNAAFPAGVTYIIHPTSKAILERAEAARAGRGGGGWKLPADAMLVSDRQSLKLGAETIDILFLGRAHTGGDLSVSLPRQKILFLSETFLNRVFPAMRSAYPTEWLKALDRAEAMKADLYIAGHGFTESGRSRKRSCASITKRWKRSSPKPGACTKPACRSTTRSNRPTSVSTRLDALEIAGADRDSQGV